MSLNIAFLASLTPLRRYLPYFSYIPGKRPVQYLRVIIGWKSQTGKPMHVPLSLLFCLLLVSIEEDHEKSWEPFLLTVPYLKSFHDRLFLGVILWEFIS